MANSKKTRVDFTGKTFGKLTVIGRDASNRGWLVRCECGTEKTMRGSYFTSGKAKSCGCLGRFKKGCESLNKSHGESKTITYRLWKAMRGRCQNTANKKYDDYGGRGIYVCRRWDTSPEAFLGDMGHRPSSVLSIDRINNEGSYTCGKHDLCDDCREKNAPANCRWATGRQQGQNKRNNRNIEAFGETHCVSEWARRLSIDPQVLFSRLNRGYTLEQAIAEPVGAWNRISNDIIRDVRRRSELGESFDSIRHIYGLSERHTLDIIERVRYADVE